MTVPQFLRKRSVLIALLAAAALLIYGQSLKNEFVIWDDDSLVTQNPLTQEMTVKTVWGAFTSYDPELYVPLTIVSFQIEHALVGFAPFFFHLDNLLLHIVAACLVLLLLERLGLARRTAFFGALFFAIHPINAEAVAWVSARKDLLAAVFSLGAMITYLSYRRTGTTVQWWSTVVLFLAGILCKPIAIVLPAIFLLLEWKEHGRIGRKIMINIIPFFALSAVFLLIGLYGKQQNIGALTMMETLFLAAKSTIFSLHKFFWPTELSSIYLQTDAISITLPQFFVPLMILCVLAGLVVWSVRRTRLVAFSALLYALFLLPSFSNFVKDDIYYFSDRYIYLSQIGLLFLLGSAVELLGKKWVRRSNEVTSIRNLLSFLIAASILVPLSWSAHAQSLLWHDSETLYHDALKKNDRSVVMHYNLAVLEHRRGNRAAALAEYQKALAIDPRYAKALSNLGVLYKEEGQPGKALEQFHLAAEADPKFPDPHSNIGSVLMDRGDVDGAIAEFRRAIAVRETFAQAHINLASALGHKGLYEDALREYKRAFQLAPQLLEGIPEVRKALENL